jgi:LacI family transcriptional regulator
VLLDCHGEANSLCSATVDDVRGGELAASHLFGLGHKTIAFVNGPTSIRQCADRREGARKALRRARRRSEATLGEITVSALAVDHGERAVAAILAATPRPTAVMCANDLLALGVLRGLAEIGISVPDEIAVVGYDDVTFASMLSPALTSVRQPKYELGATAAQLLLEEALGSEHEHRSVRFEPELIVRASSGGPRH